jgi:hypothetical protein
MLRAESRVNLWVNENRTDGQTSDVKAGRATALREFRMNMGEKRKHVRKRDMSEISRAGCNQVLITYGINPSCVDCG